MRRFVLYVLFVPIVGSLVTAAYQAIGDVRYLLSMTGTKFSEAGLMLLAPFYPLLHWPGLFVWIAYLNWLIPALAIAVADRFLPSQGWRRLGMISAVGYVATLATIGLLWENFFLALIGAITAIICCWVFDEFQKVRLDDIVSPIHKWINTLRTWPN